jgi:hypothetical protein
MLNDHPRKDSRTAINPHYPSRESESFEPQVNGASSGNKVILQQYDNIKRQPRRYGAIYTTRGLILFIHGTYI